MTNNDILRRLRYALKISDPQVVEIFSLGGHALTSEELGTIFLKDEDEGFVECRDVLAASFFDGLVIKRRGARPDAGAKEGQAAHLPAPKRKRLSNNDILKSLRIALFLKDDDIIDILGLAGVTVGKTELSAIFRKPDHKNFRPCGDQFLRNFLVGLTKKFRGGE